MKKENMKDYILSAAAPAKSFKEAYPIGNGSAGAMVYGGLPFYRCSLNMDTLWAGKPGENDHVHVLRQDLEKARGLIRQGDYAGAQAVVQGKMTGNRYNECYVSAGSLEIEIEGFPGFPDMAGCEGGKGVYRRELFLNDACAGTEYIFEGHRLKIRSFISASEDVLVTRIISDVPICISAKHKTQLKAEITDWKRTGASAAEDAGILLLGEAPSHVEPIFAEAAGDPFVYDGGMKFAICTEAACTDGRVAFEQGNLEINDAREILLLTGMVNAFRGPDRQPEADLQILKKELTEKLAGAELYTWKELYDRHRAVHEELFNRTELEIGSLSAREPVNSYELIYQYGRYLMICSSRPAGPFTQPANLQGIWCEDIRPMWSCNFTININTEMNYWCTGPNGLAECEEPLIRMIEEASISGRDFASETCGCRGFAAANNLDIWRQATPGKGDAVWAFWTMGGVWLATHLFRHYLYTGDVEWLKEKGYPVMKEAAIFCLDWLVFYDGKLHSLPSTSPENLFFDEHGRPCCVSDSSTMDIVLIREIFEEILEAAKIIGTEAGIPEAEKAAGSEGGFLQAVRDALDLLPGFGIGKYGQLMEWQEDFEEVDPHHRHFAHLTALHPFHQIDLDSRPQFLCAAEKVIDRRTGGEQPHIGWTEAWITNFYARLRKGNLAKKHLDLFLKECAYPNLMSLHPPLGENTKEREIFQIDGNFGITQGISEMLIQCKKYEGFTCIDLLPALPDDWTCGRAEGLFTVEGHRISISWEKGRIKQAVLFCRKDDKIRIRTGARFCACRKDRETETAESSKEGYVLKIQAGKDEEWRILPVPVS